MLEWLRSCASEYVFMSVCVCVCFDISVGICVRVGVSVNVSFVCHKYITESELYEK